MLVDVHDRFVKWEWNEAVVGQWLDVLIGQHTKHGLRRDQWEELIFLPSGRSGHFS